MKSRKIIALLLALVMVASIALAGCGSKPADNQGGDKIDADQTLKIVGYDYGSLDPASQSDVESFTTYQQVYEGLEREVNKDGKDGMELAGAKKVDVSPDKLTYTFTLRDDAKWSDGQPVKAQDYEFGWKRLIDPANAFDYGNFLSMVKNVPAYQDGKASIDDVGIKALDDKTFQVTLSVPTPYFEKMMAFKCLVPQRKDLFDKLGKDYGTDYKTMLYNGPFVISEYQKGSKIVYTKNDKYYDAAKVKLQKAECPIVDEPATLVQMFQNKELDQTGASGDFIAQLDAGKEAGKYSHITGTNASAFYILFSFKNPVFKSVKFRQAIIAAFDKQAFLDTVYKRFIPAYGIVPTQLMAGDTEYRKVVQEPVKSWMQTADSKALMADALKELGVSDPSKIKLTLLLGPQTTSSSAQGQFIQGQLQDKLGIKVEIKYSVDSPAYFTDRSKGNFDLCSGGWGADYNDISSYFDIFRSTDQNNNGKYNSSKYDELVKDADTNPDEAKRVEAYKQAEQELLIDNPAVVTTFYQDFQTFRYDYVKGLFMTLFGGYYDLKDTYIQGK